MPTPTPPFRLTVGPVLYYWPRQALLDFYAQVAESPAATVVLGEVVCSRRREMKTADWLDLARDLAGSGKDVILASQALVESEADLRTLRRIAEQRDFLVEAGDASAVQILSRERVPFVIGPHVNVYSQPALDEYRRLGAVRWVAPVELSLQDIAAVRANASPLPTEVFAFGRLPLAFSARCFTARHHRLSKDQCEFRCREDADGLLLSSTEGEPFLVLNGIQTQSASQHCLIRERAALQAAGVTHLRLSPASTGLCTALDLFEGVMNGGADPQIALETLARLGPAAGLVDGFAHARAGMAWSGA